MRKYFYFAAIVIGGIVRPCYVESGTALNDTEATRKQILEQYLRERGIESRNASLTLTGIVSPNNLNDDSEVIHAGTKPVMMLVQTTDCGTSAIVVRIIRVPENYTADRIMAVLPDNEYTAADLLLRMSSVEGHTLYNKNPDITYERNAATRCAMTFRVFGDKIVPVTFDENY